jgi:hypothetical protein
LLKIIHGKFTLKESEGSSPTIERGAGARTESLGKLKEEQLKVAPKGA